MTLAEQLGDPTKWRLSPWSGFFAGNMVNLPQCPVCGAAVWDAVIHAAWHTQLGQ